MWCFLFKIKELIEYPAVEPCDRTSVYYKKDNDSKPRNAKKLRLGNTASSGYLPEAERYQL
jgi:hypothetical protein